MSDRDHILIIGAGLGGLVLAIGLRDAGFPITVFERDASPTERNQGYYNRYSQFGLNALRNLIPDRLIKEMEAQSNQLTNEGPDNPFAWHFISADGSREQRVWVPPALDPLVKSVQEKWIWIRRDAFRKVLIREMAGNIKWKHRFASHECSDDGITVTFSNGSCFKGKLLVGCDGNMSKVAAAMGIPPPYTSKTELISGLVENTPEVLSALDRRRQNCLSLTSDYTTGGPTPRAGPAILQTVQSDTSPISSWMSVRREGFVTSIDNLPKAELAGLAKETLQGFDPSLTRIVELTEPHNMIPWKLRVRSKVPEWTTQPRITLLGDAIHSMSPAGGNGANMAFVSASMLLKALTAGRDRIGKDAAVLKEYEDSMRSTANMIMAGVKQMSVGIFGIDYE